MAGSGQLPLWTEGETQHCQLHLRHGCLLQEPQMGAGRRQLRPDLAACNARLSALGRGHAWRQVLAELRRLPLRSLASWGAAVDACARAAIWRTAFALAEEMVETEQTNLIICNSLIHACEKASQWPMALQLLQDMERRGPEPDIRSFNSALRACAQRWPKPLQLWRIMEAKGLSPRLG
ncbi:unnamed protein product [Effrenium voratum]|nr:unnamed protein product [Effrenium voratum]